jgi:M3 family oligoendopeptidase
MRFSEMPYSRPDTNALRDSATARLAAWKSASSAEEQLSILTDWERQEQRISTLSTMAYIRFQQDTSSEQSRAERTFFDQINPDLQGDKIRFLQAVLGSPHRSTLEARLGGHVFQLWEAECTTFRDEIAADKRTESALTMRYSSAMAALRIPFQGAEYTLSTLRAFFGNPDRSVRLAATQAQAKALATIQDDLDEIYGQLVETRDRMARSLGHDTYTPLGYSEMHRTDYTDTQVAAFRQAVQDTIVPLAARIRARQADKLGIQDYGFHDEAVNDKRGAPRPQGDHDWMMERASQMFSSMGTDFGDFFQMMKQRELLDLKSRDGKAGGGFCASFETHGVPFIFANFNGTQDDVNVFTHECGHAFQVYSSRNLSPREYLWPTYEAAEILSMGLEFLCYPHMHLFFGDSAPRFRTGHLESAITFIPYGAAIDEFQHRVYASPSDRGPEWHASWKDLEASYLPWRRYQDTPFFEEGRLWQRQRHVYNRPFYYIDYCIAQLCALQLWSRARKDRTDTMRLYRDLCNLGGSMPFTALLETVGLENPFDPAVIARLSAEISDELGL